MQGLPDHMRRPGAIEPPSLELAKLREIRFTDYAIRLGFGAGISLVSALVSMRFGYRLGGLFLAFPAILPASLTLIEEKEDRARASDDARGALLGGVGLAVFALVAMQTLQRLPVAASLAMAFAAWLGTSLALFMAVYGWRLRRR